MPSLSAHVVYRLMFKVGCVNDDIDFVKPYMKRETLADNEAAIKAG